MKDHEIEKAFMDMTASDVPDLWDRIDAATPVSVEEKKMENKEKRSWKNFFFGGGTFKTAIAVCLIIVLGAGVLNGIGGGLRMGSAGKSYSNSYAAAAEAKEYSSDSAYGYASGSSADYDMEEAEAAAFDLSEETPMADAGDGSASNGTAAMTAEAGAAAADEVTESAAASARKLIRHLNLDVETLDFDKMVEELKKRTAELWIMGK